jgi:hypothetical protein
MKPEIGVATVGGFAGIIGPPGLKTMLGVAVADALPVTVAVTCAFAMPIETSKGANAKNRVIFFIFFKF